MPAAYAADVMRIDFIVALLAVSIPLVALARRMNVGYPVLLVLGGLVLGFHPRAPASGDKSRPHFAGVPAAAAVLASSHRTDGF
jgi:hypothetical protein